jgi:hypothetical protein
MMDGVADIYLNFLHSALKNTLNRHADKLLFADQVYTKEQRELLAH